VKAEYIFFYLEGREARKLKADIDTQAIAEQVLAGKGDIHELLHKAVSDAAKGLMVDRQKRQWLGDFEDEIKESGGDGDAAYEHYCRGRVDELVFILEPEVLSDLDEDADDGEEEEDDDEEEPDDKEH
jgi:hypothetical protein